MRISDWSSDVCSSDLAPAERQFPDRREGQRELPEQGIAGRTCALDARVVAAEPHRQRSADPDVEAIGPIHPVLIITEAADPFDRTQIGIESVRESYVHLV